MPRSLLELWGFVICDEMPLGLASMTRGYAENAEWAENAEAFVVISQESFVSRLTHPERR
jgi:hypothetical protein